MKLASQAAVAALAAETTTLCLCWRLTRRDGAIFGATDHDQPVAFASVDYRPSQALAGGVFESSSRLAPGSASASGVLDAEFLAADDLEAGLWDRARVDVWRVDWTDPSQRVRIWSGRIGEVSRSGAGFAAELVSLKADLERSIGRVYTRACDAEVGDARCGVNLAVADLRGAGVVVNVVDGRIAADGLSAFAADWFRSGRLTWTSGAGVGRSHRVIEHLSGASVVLVIAPAPIHAPQAGDTFLVYAGCDKRFGTCIAKFGNAENFRGFPHMPGNDVLLAGPQGGSGDDGGRRA